MVLPIEKDSEACGLLISLTFLLRIFNECVLWAQQDKAWTDVFCNFNREMFSLSPEIEMMSVKA